MEKYITFFFDIDWISVSQIVIVDFLLAGDNALLIAVVCRNLSSILRIRAIFFGIFFSVFFRVILTFFTITLLQKPYVKLLSGIFLFWISITLYKNYSYKENNNNNNKIGTAIITIIFSDLVMSIDNVIAIASIIEHVKNQQLFLLVLSILISIPVILFGSAILLKVLNHIPFFIILSIAFLGYLSGNIIITDIVIQPLKKAYFQYCVIIIPNLTLTISVPGLISAFFALLFGKLRSIKFHNI